MQAWTCFIPNCLSHWTNASHPGEVLAKCCELTLDSASRCTSKVLLAMSMPRAGKRVVIERRLLSMVHLGLEAWRAAITEPHLRIQAHCRLCSVGKASDTVRLSTVVAEEWDLI